MKSLKVSFLLACAMLCGGIVFSMDKIDKNVDLTKVEVFNSDVSTQLMLFFSGPSEFQATQDATKARFSVLFKKTNLGNHDKEALVAKMAEHGFVKNAFLERVTGGTRLIVDFVTDQVYVKMFPLDSKTRYVVEIYSLPALNKMRKTSEGPLLYAYNDRISIFGDGKKKTFNFGSHRARVVIDAGHGGDAHGAHGLCNLVEKDVSLDIARKMGRILHRAGYEVVLTRSGDHQLSLLERSEIAQANKADLFVSVHANSAGDSQKPSGIETFHLNTFPFYSTQCAADGYDALFSAHDSCQEVRKAVDEVLRNKDGKSHQLAQNIQNALISVLHNKEYNVTDRGVKKAQFHVLLRGDVPAALVEVGFITNQQEAQHLSNNGYRFLVAQAICFGVHKFIKTKGGSNHV